MMMMMIVAVMNTMTKMTVINMMMMRWWRRSRKELRLYPYIGHAWLLSSSSDYAEHGDFGLLIRTSLTGLKMEQGGKGKGQQKLTIDGCVSVFMILLSLMFPPSIRPSKYLLCSCMAVCACTKYSHVSSCHGLYVNGTSKGSKNELHDEPSE